MFSEQSKAKIWEIYDRKAKMTIAKLSTNSQKDGKFFTDFSSRVKLIGKAHLANVQAGDKIKILKCGVSNSYNKETATAYTDFVVFDLEILSSAQTGTTDVPQAQPLLDDFAMLKIDESSLPF